LELREGEGFLNIGEMRKKELLAVNSYQYKPKNKEAKAGKGD